MGKTARAGRETRLTPIRQSQTPSMNSTNSVFDTMPRLGIGLARVGGGLQGGCVADTEQLLRRALDAGITHIDTADIYAQGESERLIGRTIAGKRDQVFIATKGGYKWGASPALLAKLRPVVKRMIRSRPGARRMLHHVRGRQMKQEFSEAHLTAALEGSLRRLGTEYVDLYHLHSPPEESLMKGDVYEWLNRLKQQGKIRFTGVACVHPEHALTAIQGRVDVVQLALDWLHPAPIQSVLPVAEQAGVGVVARRILGGGWWAKEPEAWTTADIGGDDQALARARAMARALQMFGPLPDVALKYWLKKAGITAVLLGVSRMATLERNRETGQSAPMSDADERAIDTIIMQGTNDS